MLLSYLNVWSEIIPLRGNNYKSDSIIEIKLELIREANAKLIERKYLLKINNQQDSIIKLKNDYINEQNTIIDTLQNKIINNQIINNNLQRDIKKQNNKIKTYSVGGFLIGVIIGLIIN